MGKKEIDDAAIALKREKERARIAAYREANPEKVKAKQAKYYAAIFLVVRICIAVILIALIVAYTVGVISGAISGDSKIDAIHLIMIMLTVLVTTMLVQPEIFERFKRLKFSGIEVEMIERVKENENQLKYIRMIIPLLLPETERNHLINLAQGETSNYQGNHELRSELRRLRNISLIRMVNNKNVADLKDGQVYTLSDFVELTPSGQEWVSWIKKIGHEG